MNNKKVAKIVFVVSLACLILIFGYYLLKYYAYHNYYIPDKNIRIENLIESYGSKKEYMKNNIYGEIGATLTWGSNWDNLFLSENFKNKYKNRKGIISDIDKFKLVGSSLDFIDGKEVIIIKLNYDDSIINSVLNRDNISTECVFEYFLDSNYDIDDLQLIERYEYYSDTGIRLDGKNKDIYNGTNY